MWLEAASDGNRSRVIAQVVEQTAFAAMDG